ncbi:MAG TPA: DUF2332 domain-containing protein [Caulobacteraceae bacterium]|jgi:hypothetical protein|nr:DUF2332 domain-containing protein [Caulobacteraceae bacterium]
MAEHAQVNFVPLMRERAGILQWSERRRRMAPLFSFLHRLIAENDELFALADEAQPDQLSARMLLSAVHYLLLGDPSDPLAKYFPSITAEPLPPEASTEAFKAFCSAHRDEIVDILHTRTLQTTNTDRAAQMLFAINEVAKTAGEPLSIIEVGCSAGLLTLFDRYAYAFDDGTRLGAPDAEVVVSSFRFLGDAPARPQRLPKIASRVGLDLNPVAVENPDARRWILACSVSDQVDKFQELKRALDYRARTPLEVVAGDAMQTLPPALSKIEGPVCVFHSRCLYQWPPAAQESFSAMLRELSVVREIHRVGIEANGDHVYTDDSEGSVSEIVHTVYRGGKSETRLLGRVVNKTRIEWLV